MILERVEIENLFCYYGPPAVFDFTVPEGRGGNICLIHGRNGHGKTSFLNCMKLLLLGSNSEEMRSSAVPGRTLPRNQYVLGTTDPSLSWGGILNRPARREGIRKTSFRVAGSWRRPDGEVEVERCWETSAKGDDFTERLSVRLRGAAGEQVLPDGEGKEFLENEILHPSLVSFFFFDGEQVQNLAAADDRTLIEATERLLGLQPLMRLRDEVDGQRKTFQQEARDGPLKTKLAGLEAKRNTLLAGQAEQKQRREDATAELEFNKRRLREIDREIDALQGRDAERDRATLRARAEALEKSIERLTTGRIGSDLPVNAPFLFNPALVRLLIDRVAELEPEGAAAARAQAELLGRLVQALPIQVFEHPPHSDPPLTEQQRWHYKQRLEKHLTAYEPVPPPRAPQVPTNTLAQVRKRLVQYAASRDRPAFLDDLRRLLAEKGELAEVYRLLDNIEGLTEVDKHRWAALRAERDRLLMRQGFLESEIKGASAALKSIGIELSELERQVTEAERQLREAEDARSKLRLAYAALRFLDDLLDRIRRSRRTQIERLLNQHFRQLFTSHGGIQTISVRQDLGLEFRGPEGELVGKGVSAGMKQLVAVSLLWTLKDAAATEMPMIIDTPLARLDREHQENLLVQYFPRVATQVILLPTDSELDETKYRRIEGSVYRQYHLLNNPSGDRTRIEPNVPMYEPCKAVSEVGV